MSTRLSSEQAPEAFQQWFHHVAPYINAHRNRTFILSLPGEGFDHIALSHFAADLALLQSLGINMVLTFGCQAQMQEALKQENQQKYELCDQKQVTDGGTLETYLKVCGKLLSQLNAAFSLGLPHSPLYGAAIEVLSGNWVVAQPYGIHEGVDYQFTGKIRKLQVEALKQHLGQNRLPILPPLGYSPTGECFTLSYDELALSTASQLNAEKLICFTDFDQLVDDSGQPLREIQLPLRKPLSFQNERMQKTFEMAQSACEQGVNRVHLLSYGHSGALLKELFTREGAGTLITAHRIEKIRTAKLEDVSAILELTHPMEAQGMLTARSQGVLEKDIEKFSVIERDGTVIGCAALYAYPSSISELACVAIAPEYQGQQKGKQLVNHMLQKARHQGTKKVFLLTTHASHWFQELGFQPAEVTCLPVERQDTYCLNRNSKVLIQDTQP